MLVIVAINAADIWSLRDVRDWAFGQTGAAWLQAVGALAGIYAAILVGQLQTDAAREVEAARASNQVDGLAHVLIVARDAVQALAQPEEIFQRAGSSQQPASSRAITDAAREFLELYESISGIALDQLPGETAVACIAAARASLRRVKAFADGTRNSLDFDDDVEAINAAITVLNDRIVLLRFEALRLLRGDGPSHSAAAAIGVKGEDARG